MMDDFRNAEGVIFLTNYTSQLIQKICGVLKKTIIIPHGFNPLFYNLDKDYSKWNSESKNDRRNSRVFI